MSNMNEITENIPNNDTIVCYAPKMVTIQRGIWIGENPLNFSVPLFITQLLVIVITSRLLHFVLKPLRQPRVISEILGGLILGPSVLGRITTNFGSTVFPLRSVVVLETMANVGLLYFFFLIGVEMELSFVQRTGRKAVAFAFAGMLLPFIIGCISSFLLQTDIMVQGSYILILAVVLSATAFPVLARILAELKLLHMEIGRIAMSSALISDLIAWVLLAFAIALAENKNVTSTALWMILCSTAFVIFCIFVVRPAIRWLIKQTPEGETYSESTICLILTGVMISGFITDAIGTHAVFGAFVFGLVIPNETLRVTLIEKLEDFVTGILLPLFFANSGLKTRITQIKGAYNWALLLIIILFACAGKVTGTLLVAYFYKMPLREAITLGLLMNTKGLIEMIVLNVAKEHNVVDEKSFTILVIASVFMTGIITPIVTTIYRPARKSVAYNRRAIQKSNPDAELRILVCIHTLRNVPTIISLLEASYPTRKSPISVYVLHLVELTGRASAMLIVHGTQESNHPALNRTQAQSDQIIKAFKNFELHISCVSVQPRTAISSYSTMHEDICNLAENKHVAFIIIPFHKQQTVDGGMSDMNPAFRMLNQNVLAKAPCSVGILVDRGLSGSTRLAADQTSHHIAVLFFGGPDDREALSYALRMAQHPGNTLTVIQFLPGEDAVESGIEPSQDPTDPRVLTVKTDNDTEKHLDADYIKDFRMMVANDDSFIYREKVVNNGEETVAAIRSLGSIHDLFIVGRGQGMISPVTAGLTDWSECPELGAIGDFLASSDFAATVSVLVVQQYIGVGKLE